MQINEKLSDISDKITWTLQWSISGCYTHYLLISLNQALFISIQQRIMASSLFPALQIIMIIDTRQWKQLVKTVSHLLLSKFISCKRPDPVKCINTTKQSMIKLRFGFRFNQDHSAVALQRSRKWTWLLLSERAESASICYIWATSQRDAYCILYFKRNYITVCCYGALSGEVAVVFACLVRGRAACRSSLMQSSCTNSR